MAREDDLLKYPEAVYIKLSSDRYQAEQELAEKYRSVVSEILRLSLAGFAVFAFLQNQHTLKGTKYWATAGIACFAASVGLSLWFLFEASEGLRWYVAGMRYSALETCVAARTLLAARKPCVKLDRARAMLKRRDRIIRRCRWSKFGAAVFLFAGISCMGVATLKPLFLPESAKPATASSGQVREAAVPPK